MAAAQVTDYAIVAPKHMPAEPYPHGLKSIGGATLADVLGRLGETVAVGPLPGSGSAFVKPASVFYELDGKRRRWDVMDAHASVGVVLYHRDLDAFLIVRQFRPAVFATRARDAAEGRGAAPQGAAAAAAAASAPPSPPPPSPGPPLHAGFTYELCAGLCDKAGKPPEEVAAEEVLEECGFAISSAAVRKITSAVSSAGTAGALHTLFFAAVTDAMRAQGGGGGLADTGEAIEILALPFDAAPALVLDASLPMSPGLQFGLIWARGELDAGRLGGRSAPREVGGGGDDGGGLLTAELRLKPVLPA